MSATARRDQLSRLLQIMIALRSGHPNARDLAELCEVSPRTIYRDLSALEMAGVPIRYRGERQGYEIATSFAMPVPHLSRSEALALGVSARMREEEPLLGRDVRQAVQKVLATLPTIQREDIEALGQLVVVTGPDAPRAQALDVSGTLFEAFSTRKQVRTWYEEGGDSPFEKHHEALIGSYRLVRAFQAWHLLGISGEIGHPIVSLGLDAIRKVELTDRPYTMPSDAQVRIYLGRAGLASPVPPTAILATLRISRGCAALIEEAVWHPADVRTHCRPDELLVTLLGESIEELAQMLVALGCEVEVLAPPELRLRLLELRQSSGRSN